MAQETHKLRSLINSGVPHHVWWDDSVARGHGQPTQHSCWTRDDDDASKIYAIFCVTRVIKLCKLCERILKKFDSAAYKHSSLENILGVFLVNIFAGSFGSFKMISSCCSVFFPIKSVDNKLVRHCLQTLLLEEVVLI